MNAKLYVSRLSGTAAVPPSKSAAHRAVVCAGLAGGTSHIEHIEYSDDIRATMDAVRQLGAKVVEGETGLCIEGCKGFATITHPVYCKESGSTLRFLIPLFSLTAQRVRFTGAPRLFQRPQEVYHLLFQKQGNHFEQTEAGITILGQLRPGEFTLPGDVSSQFISGLLFAAPLLEQDSIIRVAPPFESKSYVDMTMDALRRFGIRVDMRAGKQTVYRVAGNQHYTPCDAAVEGDYSQAAFLGVLGCLVGGITVQGLAQDTHQGDKVILDILRRCGGKLAVRGDSIKFERSLLQATEIDLADCPDLGPALIVLGCFCRGTTVLRNAGRLRLKESDRIAAMQQELRKMGAQIEAEADGSTVTITGVALHAPTEPLLGHNDHRVVMSLAVAAYGAGVPAMLLGANAINKSWPGFFGVLQSLGAKVVLEDDAR
ncbi:MAG: 3-phosphoshikimate 1-carboxyvinyltransferase [Gemmiger sp.]|nr:3-phosphoshikimate 1-carboxyvinyltransferase [Gemmiger sp.]